MDGSLNVVGSDATTPRHLDAAESGRLERSHSQGHSRPKRAIHGVSALPPLATELRTTPEVRFVTKNEPALAGGAGGAVGRLRLPQ
jgi:hypothetical protein